MTFHLTLHYFSVWLGICFGYALAFGPLPDKRNFLQWFLVFAIWPIVPFLWILELVIVFVMRLFGRKK